MKNFRKIACFAACGTLSLALSAFANGLIVTYPAPNNCKVTRNGNLIVDHHCPTGQLASCDLVINSDGSYTISTSCRVEGGGGGGDA